MAYLCYINLMLLTFNYNNLQTFLSHIFSIPSLICCTSQCNIVHNYMVFKDTIHSHIVSSASFPFPTLQWF